MYLNLLQWILAASLFPSAVLCAPSTWDYELIEDRQVPTNSCAQGVHVIAQPGAHHGGTHYSRIGTLVTNITSMIPHSSSFLTGPYGPGSFIQQTERVGRQLRSYLAYYHKKCPDTKLVLVGYSTGGVTTLNVLCGASPVPPWTASDGTVHRYPIVAAVTYGEETYTAGMPYDVSTCKSNAPNGHRTNVTGCEGFYHKIQDYCLAQDSECCGTGKNYSAHFIYQEFDVKAATFVRKQWLASINAED